MAIADNILLLFKFIANIIKIYHINVYDFCIPLFIIIPQAANFISIWIVLIMTAERTITVIYPFSCKKIFSRKICKITIWCTVLFFSMLTSTAGLCSHHDKNKPYTCIIKNGIGSYYEFYFHSVYQVIKTVFGSWLPSLISLCH